MHTIEPARLKPGVTVDALPEPKRPVDAAPERDGRLTGKALIFWDPLSLPGTRLARKLDAIDTDQITPAADCVSESLDTLDERWKAGSFRYLMPDFRARVHRGETFVIAGDRFAIGSSREMSPAGLKGVAEEAGLRAGRGLRRATWGTSSAATRFNLGLHVVQSPEAVADARDGDDFSFDPVTRQLAQRDPRQDLHAGAALGEGRGDSPQRRHLRGRPPRVQAIGGDDPQSSTGRACRRSRGG